MRIRTRGYAAAVGLAVLALVATACGGSSGSTSSGSSSGGSQTFTHLAPVTCDDVGFVSIIWIELAAWI